MFWKKIILIIALISLVLFIYNYIQISKPYINKINIKSKKITKDIKITQITDFHSNKYINLDKLFENIKEYQPDIIVLTGDIIDHKTTDLKLALDLAKRATKMNKNVYFVSGNHEDRNPLYTELAIKMKSLGVVILNNESTVIDINGVKINIAGVKFYLNREDYNRAITNINVDNYTILLSHSPNRPIKYLTGMEDLIISGHTHGGQVRLPFIGAIIAPGQGLFPKYDKGIIEIENTTLYIDSGLGNSVYPIRLFNRVQISNIVIESDLGGIKSDE